MIQSMTAFASRSGGSDGASWSWEIRGVNGKGLDLRLRLPDGVPGLEQAVRAALTERLGRGNVTVTLKLTRDAGAEPVQLDEGRLARVLEALDHIAERAAGMGVTLAQPTAADVLATRGVVAQGEAEEAPDLLAPLMADFAALMEAFAEMRAGEGRALEEAIAARLDEIAGLVDAAEAAAEARRGEARAALTANLRRVVEDVSEIDEARIAQELAMLAVKADIAEEIERLRAHVAAARALLAEDKPSGRRLDFLAQEFNREANTLCSKSGNAALTTIGLDLKAAIDRMREQIQNAE